MARLRDDYAEFVGRGAEVIAIGPEGPGDFGRFWRAKRIPFIGIPDPDHRIARLYRQEVNLFKLGRMPLVALVDSAGLIQFAHRADSMSDIPGNQMLLEIIDRMAAQRGGSAGPP